MTCGLHHGSWLLSRHHIFVAVGYHFDVIGILFERALAVPRTGRGLRNVEGVVSPAAVFHEPERGAQSDSYHSNCDSQADSNGRTVRQA